MYEMIVKRINKGRKTLFDPDDECLTGLYELIQNQSHKTLILWALELAEGSVRELNKKYIDDSRPENALNLSKQWAAGEVKMPIAKKAILECHSMAKELTDVSDIALCHAIGQACSVVHTKKHAMGYPVYELTAIVRQNKTQFSKESVKQRIGYYIERLLFWQKESDKDNRTRANFIH